MDRETRRRYLNMQADRIEAVCRENGLMARVGSGVVGPRLVVFHLHVGSNAANLVDRLRKLEETLALRLGQAQVQVRREAGRLLLLTPAPGKPRPVWLESYRRFLRPNTLFLGVRADAPDHPLLINPGSPDVSHLLVAGSTGSGKTVLLRTMIVSLAWATPPEKAQIVLIDPKGSEFGGMERLPHVVELVRGQADVAAAVLAELAAEMNRRGQTGQKTPRIYVFIDELADLLDQGGEAVIRPLTRLAQRARGTGIHLIGGTQKPTNDSIGGLVKFNFVTRIAGSVPSASDAVVASGVSQSGAERLLGQGDFMLFGPARARFQAARVREVEAVISRIIENVPAEPPVRRQWVYEDEPPSKLSKLLSFPLAAGRSQEKDGRGGHNAEPFTPAQIADARSGLTAHYLRKKYPNLSGSRADRLTREYGPSEAERKAK